MSHWCPDGLELAILLPQPAENWNYRHVPLSYFNFSAHFNVKIMIQ
jgi:hypothetical protein